MRAKNEIRSWQVGFMHHRCGGHPAPLQPTLQRVAYALIVVARWRTK